MAPTAEQGLEIWRGGGCELILLDVMLPGMNGFEMCRLIRAEGDRVPILFLTARSAGQDRINGLDQGGDDYITKPFDLQELLARIKSIFRRQDWFRSKEPEQLLAIGRAEVDLRKYRARTPDGTVELKEKEVMILRLLAEHVGEPVDRETILDRVWGFGAYPTTRTVDNFILSLRKIIEEDPRNPRYILTVHGVGYRLADDALSGPAGA
jgi:DNA-binding response OmpR family regulator